MAGNRHSGWTALSRVRGYFPRVRRVVDAKRAIEVTVTPKDGSLRRAKVKDPTQCAMAQACMRQEGADGAVIGLGTSYVVTGSKATRYRTPPTVAREISSFDKRAGFQAGTYTLEAPPPSSLIGAHRVYHRRSANDGSRPRRHTVHTEVSFRRI